MPADDELVQRAKQGDPDAWRELYRAHAGRLVVWLGTRPSGDAAVSAEDLAGEAWLVAARKVADFTGTSSEFAGWLFGIARNLSSTTHRRSQRRHTVPSAEPAADTVVDGPESLLVARDVVARLLRHLTPRERDVVACLEVVGLDVDGTARALGISAVAVRVARHRGLRRLRALATEESRPGQPSAASNGAR